MSFQEGQSRAGRGQESPSQAGQGDPGELWASLPVTKKVRLQQAIFPDGLTHDGSTYRTAVTSGAFAACAKLAAENGKWRPREDSNLWHSV